MPGLVVGLTGATGHIGGRLLQRLLADPGISQVRSVARRPLRPPAAQGDGASSDGASSYGASSYGAGRLRHTLADLASPLARRALEGCDVVYHLAAQVWEGRGEQGMAAMYSANVTGTANIASADVGAFVLASSVAVYGARPDNPLPMDEAQRPRPNPECPYGQHKWLAEMATATSANRWCTLRLCGVLGPHADARVARATHGLRMVVPTIKGRAQALQWLDEGDAVAGLLAAGQALVEGREGVAGQVFNIATTDWLEAEATAKLAGGRLVELPRDALMAVSRLARWSRLSPFGPDRAVLVDGTLAVSPARAERVLGWRASRQSVDVLASALRRPWRSAPLNR